MKHIFVTGMGRSGTKFLGHLLSHAADTEAHHEYIGNREYWLLSWYLAHDVYAVPYLQRSRAEIDKHFEGRTTHFVDVNSYLQNSVEALRQVFDNPPIFHLVRDPRAVVPSIYLRRDEEGIHLVPKERADVERWLDADKFEQICWNWMNTTRQLLDQETVLLQFEKITTDFDYLRERLLEPCRLELSRQQWEDVRSQKVNETRSRLYRYLYAKLKGKGYEESKLPSYKAWTKTQREILSDLCGPLMRQVGYAL